MTDLNEKSETEQGYHNLYNFNFLGENYAFSTMGKPEKDKPVFLRCVNDPNFPAQETRIPAPYDHDIGMDTIYETWDSKGLEFIVDSEGTDFININIQITKRSGYSYPGKFDDSVPSYIRRNENVFLKRDREQIAMRFPGMGFPGISLEKDRGLYKRVDKKFKV